MSRHIIDAPPSAAQPPRLSRYLKLARQSGEPRPSAIFGRTPRFRDGDRKLEQFTRIDRAGPGRV